MKYAKLLRTACLAAALVCGAAVGNAKNGVVPKMYMFGFAASFSDSIVHFTDVQELKDVWIDTKTDFLLGRDSYSYQLRDYLAGKNMGHRTCVVVFNKSRKKLEKELQKMKELYGPAKDGKQYKATITLSIPLKDWGKRKNAYLAARSTVDVAERAEQESARDIELEVALTVADFNERQSIVETSRQALTIAEDTYAQTLQRFIRAQANAYDLSLAQSHWQTARQNQIASLQNYWLSYFHLRRLTLYDYQHNKSITYK